MLKAIQTLHALTCVATDSHIGRKTISRALRRRYARLVPGYHILHHRGAATRSCERPLRHHIIDKRGRCEAPVEGLFAPKYGSPIRGTL